MREWFSSHTGLEQLFLLCAIIGGTLLILRLIFSIAGLDSHDGDFDAPHTSSDAGFQLLTIQGVSSFFTMFGLVGYALNHNTSLGTMIAVGGAVLAGFTSVWVIQRIFLSMLRLQSSGSLPLDATIGSQGTVYLTVTPNGGRVQVSVANRLREFEAVSASTEELPTGTQIRVERIAANTLVVSRLNK